MPVYIYKNVATGEVREVVQGMNDEHSYGGESGEEKWDRVFLPPNASIDSRIDPFSQDAFREKTATKRGTIGNLMDASAELSEKRTEIAGHEDPVKRQYFDDYARLRKGAKHPKDKPKKIETKDVTIEF